MVGFGQVNGMGLNRARMGLGQRDTSTKATPHGLTPLSNPALYNYTRRSDSLRANNSLTRGKHG